MNDLFKGQAMLITGAAQGIGQRVAELAAERGARLALVDRSPLVHELRERLLATCGTGGVIAIEADLEQFTGAEDAAAQAHKAFRRIDVLVNNVGGTIWTKPYEHYRPEEIEAEVRRSLFPTLWCCRAVLPYMLKKKKGAIVNVSSIATRSIHRAPYGAAKGGVNTLTACLAFENGERGIRVNAVAPGGTEAPPRRIPRNTSRLGRQDQAWYQQIVDQTVSSTLMKRYGTLDEQAEAILFLASDRASYITGTVLPVGGGDQG
ncbi:1,6-dihydroxycyclohexa-2,4-diene-1-carboxylate dehydrogenase [Paracidovorax wautersii]|uniref:1,2-dihydroxycyclohexa-3,5-diene-1-carboxylate dehydrogenase n=1 Tax=Paracidovorax wautersii TaxID=1177982 RepID=A0A1I2GX16_9BURK|nr:1,6-dihydroxycyclohexa-2,4-diene-1-carboxylate dehydrogenase [Paracidovorax wautersii]SFF21317.1 1,2-dihydroxycyclohexa-3,5-diene-1-carboxylate dehydrogenase [Paracidovorax wautersii]